MSLQTVPIERLTLTSSQPFDAVLARLKFALGRPDVRELSQAMVNSRSGPELEEVVHRAEGSSGMILFGEFDQGMVLRKELGPGAPRLERLLIGNPLIMKEMAKHVPDVGSYAPVSVLISEQPDGVHLAYDRMASLLAPYGSPEALEVARELDGKIESLLQSAAA